MIERTKIILSESCINNLHEVQYFLNIFKNGKIIRRKYRIINLLIGKDNLFKAN